MSCFAFGTGTNTDQAVSVASKTYTVGASGIWYQWLWLFATPFNWLLAPLYRRMRAVTTADYLTVRYDMSVALLFAVTDSIQGVLTIVLSRPTRQTVVGFVVSWVGVALLIGIFVWILC